MAYKYTKIMGRIGNRMSSGNRDISRWLLGARYAKTSNGYWLAWHEGDTPLDRVSFLAPNHPEGKECEWLESWGNSDTIDSFIEYVESGEFERDEQENPDGFVLNLFIKDPETGEWH